MKQTRKLRQRRHRRSRRLMAFAGIATVSLLLTGYTAWRWLKPSVLSADPANSVDGDFFPQAQVGLAAFEAIASLQVPAPNGRPRLYPLPDAEEVWQCEVVVIGGTLGGVAAASHAMSSGAQTCLIEVSPWLGGQISSQGVSAIDESSAMRRGNKFSTSWQRFKDLISQQSIELPPWTGAGTRTVDQLNSCWVGDLCFPPKAGDRASQQLLEQSAQYVEGSRWSTSTAFKGASFDETGRNITAIHAVRRSPLSPDYQPEGQLWSELASWYSWSDDDEFDKVPIRIEPPSGRSFLVIDATDTGELVGWARIPHRQGSESIDMTQEAHAPAIANPDCTQAFTFPFVVAIHDDGGESLKRLQQVESEFNLIEHWREYSLNGTPMFSGRSFFNYRRMVSLSQNDPIYGTPIPGDMTLVNWNPGNDWNWMDPPLILSEDRLLDSGQYLNWMGGISSSALRHGASHALLFGRWLLEEHSQSGFDLSLLDGVDSPMGTQSGLSLAPYIREGRRILGRDAYGESDFMVKATDVRWDFSGGRQFDETAVALTHYDLDMHGCRYRNWQPSFEAAGAPVREHLVRPTAIPLESLIPQEVDNMLVGGKAIAVTHIVNAMTRVHYGEWSIGAAAGSTAGWLVREQNLAIAPADIAPNQQMSELQAHLRAQGLRIHW